MARTGPGLDFSDAAAAGSCGQSAPFPAFPTAPGALFWAQIRRIWFFFFFFISLFFFFPFPVTAKDPAAPSARQDGGGARPPALPPAPRAPAAPRPPPCEGPLPAKGGHFRVGRAQRTLLVSLNQSARGSGWFGPIGSAGAGRGPAEGAGLCALRCAAAAP